MLRLLSQQITRKAQLQSFARMSSSVFVPKASEKAPCHLSADYVKEILQFPTTRDEKIVQNAVRKHPVWEMAMDAKIVFETPHVFSHKLDEWSVTDQKSSGRCWLFAGLNMLKAGTREKLDVKNFEYSQNYAMFFDKLERCNYFLEAVIDLIDVDDDDRTLWYLLSKPQEDGGQWTMFVNVLKKYGAVPKRVMPETESSSATRMLNWVLNNKLREACCKMRQLEKKDIVQLRAMKHDVMKHIARILCIHLGTPPTEFEWTWVDQHKKVHHAGVITPVQFFERFSTVQLDDYVCLVNDPRPTSQYEQVYTVKYLGNVFGEDAASTDANMVRYLNVDVATLQRAVTRSIVERKEPVWFGCDVGKQSRRQESIMHPSLLDYDAVYGTTIGQLNKAQRLMHRMSMMTHAMMFTGVDIEAPADKEEIEKKEEKKEKWNGVLPRWYRVENSWGEAKSDQKGYYSMNSGWFEEYVYEVAVHKSCLENAKLLDVLKGEVHVLPAYDPMGALAKEIFLE